MTASGRSYDSRPAPGARRGGDILPLTGQVASIELRPADDGPTRRITDPATVAAVVAGIVAAPAHAEETGWPSDFTGELWFRLRDGTTVVRQWNRGHRLISGDIELSAAVIGLLDRAR